MESDLQAQHPKFQGNWDDLGRFIALARSPIRSQQREDALRDWEKYKIEKQLAWYRNVYGRLRKGGYMKAVVARVIDLSGASLDEICIGYADLRGVILDACSLRGAWLKGSKLENASLRYANLSNSRDGGLTWRKPSPFTGVKSGLPSK